jgi:hypothetical protein
MTSMPRNGTRLLPISNGTAPKLLEVEPDGFASGDVQLLGGQSQRLLIAPLRS